MSEVEKKEKPVESQKFPADTPGHVQGVGFGPNYGGGYSPNYGVGFGPWHGPGCPVCGNPYPANPGYGCMPGYSPGCMPNQMAHLRVYHASPDAPPVDVYVNGQPIIRNLAYGNITNYLAVKPGIYNVKVYPTGTMKTPVINTNVTLLPGTFNTAAAVNRLCDIMLLPIADANVPPVLCKSNVRFAHLSPNAPRVDITLPNGAVLFRNIGFGEVTSYLPVAPGTYTLQVRVSSTNQVVLTVPNVTFTQDNYYTVYAQGLVGAAPPLEAKLVMDGIYSVCPSIKLKDYGPNPFVVNIEEATKQNNYFRIALWTGKYLQLTLMSINVGEDIGLEIHPDHDQFIRIEQGLGLIKMGDRKDRLDFQANVRDDYAIFIPAGKWHNLINTGNKPLKLYSIYAPPEHPHGTVHKTKKDAEEHHHQTIISKEIAKKT